MSNVNQLQIVLLQGTTRDNSNSLKVAQFIYQQLQQHDEVTVTLVNPRDYSFPNDGNEEQNKDARYTELTAAADAFFVVVPEYNHAFPGSLKRMLDSELKNYIHKPVAFAGVSSGPWGGVRAIESLVPVVRELGLVATFTDVQFPTVGSLFAEDGSITDDAYITRVNKSITELIWMAKALRYGRTEL